MHQIIQETAITEIMIYFTLNLTKKSSATQTRIDLYDIFMIQTFLMQSIVLFRFPVTLQPCDARAVDAV